MTFDTKEHLMQIKSSKGSSDYLPVQWRLVWFRSLNPQGTIDTEELEYDTERPVEADVYVWNPEKRKSEKTIKKSKGYARYRAIVSDGKGGRATGTKSENAANFADYGEKAETGSIGRALAALGYGTQFTGDELNEGHRIVDSPVDRHNEDSAAQSNGNGNHTPTAINATTAQVQTFNQIYNKGLQKGKWTKETFPSIASGILNGHPINKDTVAKLTAAQLAQLDAAIEQEAA